MKIEASRAGRERFGRSRRVVVASAVLAALVGVQSLVPPAASAADAAPTAAGAAASTPAPAAATPAPAAATPAPAAATPPAASAVPAKSDARDTVVLLGNVAGYQHVVAESARRTRVEYAYADRGRGDELVARWTLDGAGVPVEYVVTGKDYMKSPVNERFTWRNGRASWSVGGERGDRESRVPAVYLPLNAPFEYYGVLARALLRAPERRLALFPEGEARIEPVELAAAEREGVPASLRLFRVIGLTFSPAHIWLDADDSTGAQVSPWLSVLPAKYAAQLPQILAAQAKAETRWSAELARNHARVPTGGLLIRNARVFDPRDLSVTPGTSVLVRGERIVRVAPDAELAATGEGVEVVDARGRTLLPGLWDNHQHFGDVDGALDLLVGVTSARDLANSTDEFLERVARFDAGTELGPHVFRAGIIDGTGQYAGPTKMRAGTVEQALEHVKWYADHGYGQIKIYSSIDPKWVRPIADAAHARGMRVSGHVPAFMSASQFIAAGADEMQHLNFVVLNFLFDQVKDTRNRTRFTAVAENVATLQPNEPRVAAFVAEMKKHGVVLDPTVNIFEGMFSGQPDAIAPGFAQIAPRLPAALRRGLRTGALPVPPAQKQAYAQAFPAMLKLLKTLHDAGVTLLPGTDTLAGYGLQRELELWVQAGIPPAEVLRAATLTSARISGADYDRGTIAAGKRADLLLVDGDPTRDIGAIRAVDLVLKSGRVIDPPKLEAALGIAPR